MSGPGKKNLFYSFSCLNICSNTSLKCCRRYFLPVFQSVYVPFQVARPAPYTSRRTSWRAWSAGTRTERTRLFSSTGAGAAAAVARAGPRRRPQTPDEPAGGAGGRAGPVFPLQAASPVHWSVSYAVSFSLSFCTSNVSLMHELVIYKTCATVNAPLYAHIDERT